MDYRHTYDTIYTHFWGLTYNIYGFGNIFGLSFFIRPASTHISTRPQWVLLVQMTGRRVSAKLCPWHMKMSSSALSVLGL